jgi:hypothetical protein
VAHKLIVRWDNYNYDQSKRGITIFDSSSNGERSRTKRWSFEKEKNPFWQNGDHLNAFSKIKIVANKNVLNIRLKFQNIFTKMLLT